MFVTAYPAKKLLFSAVRSGTTWNIELYQLKDNEQGCEAQFSYSITNAKPTAYIYPQDTSFYVKYIDSSDNLRVVKADYSGGAFVDIFNVSSICGGSIVETLHYWNASAWDRDGGATPIHSDCFHVATDKVCCGIFPNNLESYTQAQFAAEYKLLQTGVTQSHDVALVFTSGSSFYYTYKNATDGNLNWW